MSEKEYKLLVKQNAEAIYHFTYKVTSNKILSQDITKETFEELWSERKNKTFLKLDVFTKCYQILFNDIRRSNISHTYTSPLNFKNKSNSTFSGITELVSKTFNGFPFKEKCILSLRDIFGFDYNEIAKITDLTAHEVKHNLFNSRLKISKLHLQNQHQQND